MSTTSTLRLSDREAELFRQEGYLRFQQNVYTPEKFAALRGFFERVLDEQTRAGLRPEQLDKPHFIYPELLAWVLCDEVLDIIQPLLGSNILLFSTHFICKPAGDGRCVRAFVSVSGQRGASPLRANVLPPVTDCNCVTAM